MFYKLRKWKVKLNLMLTTTSTTINHSTQNIRNISFNSKFRKWNKTEENGRVKMNNKDLLTFLRINSTYTFLHLYLNLKGLFEKIKR